MASEVLIESARKPVKGEPADEERAARRDHRSNYDVEVWENAVIDGVPSQLEELGEGVDPDEPQELVRNDLNRIDDRRQVHQCHGCGLIHLRHVLEVDRQRRQQQRYAESEDSNDDKCHRKKEHRRTDGGTTHDHDDEQRDVCETEVCEPGQGRRDRKNRLWHSYPFEQHAVP